MKRFDYLLRLLKFAFSANPLLYLSLALSIASVFIELFAMSALLPLAALALDQPVDPNYPTVRILTLVGIEPDIRNLVLCFALFLGGRLLTQLVSQALIFFLGKRIHAQLSSGAFARIVQTLPQVELERRSIGYFITLAGDESFRASNLVISISQVASTGVLAALYYGAILYYSIPIGLGVLAFLSVSFLALLGAFKKSHSFGVRQLEQSRLAGSLFLDVLNGLRSVRAFCAEEYVVERYRIRIFQYVKTLFLIDFVSLLARLIPALILVVALLVAVLGGSGLSDGSASYLPVLFTSIAFLMRLFPVVGQALNQFMRVIADLRAGQDLTTLILEPSVKDVAGDIRLTEQVKSIEVKHLAFYYDSAKPVLEQINLKFRQGRSYTLMGASGTGKSTLLDIVLGFHQPVSGTVLINGIALEKLAIADVRQRVLLLGQQLVVFNDTIVNNICFGMPAEASSIETATRLASIHEVILALPEGYDTLLNYRGTNLSGGQIQRIGLARALLRNPDVLILDESTSALDPETRDTVVENILREYADRIVIFVTHDRNVADRVDVVYDLSRLNAACGTSEVSQTLI